MTTLVLSSPCENHAWCSMDKKKTSRIHLCGGTIRGDVCIKGTPGSFPNQATDREAFIHSWTHRNDTFQLTCIIKINYAHMHTQTQSESAMPKPKLKRRTWDTEFSQSLGQYCCCVCLNLSDKRTNHAHLPIRTTTHTDSEVEDELISDSLADWRAVQPLVEPVSAGGAGGLDVPVTMTEGVKAQFVCDLSCVHGIRKVLWWTRDKSNRRFRARQTSNHRNGIHNLFHLSNVTSSSETGFLFMIVKSTPRFYIKYHFYLNKPKHL